MDWTKMRTLPWGSQELRREAEGLKQEAARLQRHTTLILRGLEEAGLVEYNRNEQREIVGMVTKARTIVCGSSSVSATATVRNENDAPNEQE